LPADYVAFAFHRDDAALFTAWNAVMRDWVGSQQHLDTIAPFGFDRQDVVMQGIS
jgi:polar amino acid transport system substrate-binding protein